MKFLYLILSLLPLLAHGSPTQLSEFTGTYPLYDLNGVSKHGRLVQIVGEGTSVGFVLEGVKLSKNPIPEFRALTPLKDTTFRKDGNTLIQEALTPEGQWEIRYKRLNGVPSIKASLCSQRRQCDNFLIDTFGQSISGLQSISLADFFQSVPENYKILSAGGNAPKPALDEGTLVAEIEEGVGTIGLTYCSPEPDGYCKTGVDLPYSTTKVFKEQLPSGITRYYFVREGISELCRWIQDGTKATFQRIGVDLPGGKIATLEFELEAL